MVLGATVALLVIGFSETLIFWVISTGLHRPPSFFSVLSTLQGAGSIAGGVTAAAVLRRLGDTRLVSLGLVLFGIGDGLLAIANLAVVLAGTRPVRRSRPSSTTASSRWRWQASCSARASTC